MTPGLVWAHLWRLGVLGGLVFVATVAAYLTGFAGQPLGWLWTPAVLAVGSVAVAWLLWWRRPGRAAVVGAVVPLVVALGVATWGRSPPAAGVLANTLDRVELPDGARLVEQSSGGNVLCFDVCTTVRRRYRVPTDTAPAEVADALRRSLREAGFALEDPVDPQSFTTTLVDSELHVAGRVEPAPDAPGVVVIQVRAVASG